MARSAKPRDGRHRRPDDLTDWLTLAAALCVARGVQLTALRQEILELLWQSGGPTGAYDLIRALRRRVERPIGPPTVYQALEFLVAQGLIRRIESRNAYVVRSHPESPNPSAFFLCGRCGTSAEFENPRIDRLLAEDAVAIGFLPTRRVLEVEGTCPRCRDAAPA